LTEKILEDVGITKSWFNVGQQLLKAGIVLLEVDPVTFAVQHSHVGLSWRQTPRYEELGGSGDVGGEAAGDGCREDAVSFGFVDGVGVMVEEGGGGEVEDGGGCKLVSCVDCGYGRGTCVDCGYGRGNGIEVVGGGCEGDRDE
jgi:hypothetical protein